MNRNENPYWFAAKSYGIGWALPVTWQGWVTVIVYAALLVAALLTVSDGATKLVCVTTLTIALIAVIAWKGERPVMWRWGGR